MNVCEHGDNLRGKGFKWRDGNLSRTIHSDDDIYFSQVPAILAVVSTPRAHDQIAM